MERKESMATQEDYTLSRGVTQLGDAWRTEVNSPEISPFKRDLVEFIKTKIDDQQVGL